MAETSTQEKAKKLYYERRVASIIKKSEELQILCGVKIGVVILGPNGKLKSWPPELSDVKALLDTCKERPGVKRRKRKDCREISVSKLQLLNQREEFFKSDKCKEIATTSTSSSQGATPVRSKKRKDFDEGYLETLNSKLPGPAEGKKIAAVGQDGDNVGSEFVIMDEFFNVGSEFVNMDEFFNVGSEFVSMDEFFDFEEDKSCPYGFSKYC